MAGFKKNNPGCECCDDDDIEIQTCDDVEAWAATLTEFETTTDIFFSYSGTNCSTANDCAHSFGTLILTAGSNPFLNVTCLAGAQCFYYQLPTSILLCNPTNPEGQDEYLDGWVATLSCDLTFSPGHINITLQPVMSVSTPNSVEGEIDGWLRSTALPESTSTQMTGTMTPFGAPTTGPGSGGCTKVSSVAYTLS